MASDGIGQVNHDEAPTRRGRGRRPSAEVRAAVLDAAGRLLFSDGMSGFAIERIAALAGVSKVTIYRWWPSRGVLAIEAYAAGVTTTFSMPDTGDIEADLITQLQTFVEVLSGTRAGRITAELLGAAQSDAQLADAFKRLYLEPRRAVGITRLRAARQCLQIDDDVDLEALSDQLWGSCMYRLMTGLHPLDVSFVRDLVRNAFAGVRTRTVAPD